MPIRILSPESDSPLNKRLLEALTGLPWLPHCAGSCVAVPLGKGSCAVLKMFLALVANLFSQIKACGTTGVQWPYFSFGNLLETCSQQVQDTVGEKVRPLFQTQKRL